MRSDITMTNEQVDKINVKLENDFGAGGIELVNTGLGGTQVSLCYECIAHADSETLHELIVQLTKLKEYIDKENGTWE